MAKHINPNSFALLQRARDMLTIIRKLDISPAYVELIDRWLDDLERFMKL